MVRRRRQLQLYTTRLGQRFTQRHTLGQQGPQRIPETIKAELDVPYAATDNPRQRLDLYLPKSPKNDKPLPVVEIIPQGGFYDFAAKYTPGATEGRPITCA